MIKWNYEQIDLWTYSFEIKDEYDNPIYPKSEISAPALPILIEILSNYCFARDINGTDKVFNFDGLSPEDKMDLKLASIHKLEDIEDD